MDTLETPRLQIRPFNDDDLQAAYQAIDVDIQWAGRNGTLEYRRRWIHIQEGLRQWRATGGYYGDRAVILKTTDELIGLCGFRPWLCDRAVRGLFDPARIEQEPTGKMLELGVGYAIVNAHRRQGYATEAVGALIDYGFRILKVRRIVALTGQGNEPSVRVMRRVGMEVGLSPDPSVDYPWGVGMIENPDFY